MSSRNLEFSLGEYYHLYSRGTDRREIFLSDADRDRFLALLYTCNNQDTIHLSDYPKSSLPDLLALPRGTALTALGAHVLMPNHFHLLVREEVEGGISRFMQKFLTGHTMYFNKRHNRRGILFEGRFQAKHIDNDEWLRYMFAYLHLNPVKIIDPENWERKIVPDPVRALEFLQRYKYSSFLDYSGIERAEKAIINPAAFPDYFSEPKEFAEFIKDWSEYEE